MLMLMLTAKGKTAYTFPRGTFRLGGWSSMQLKISNRYCESLEQFPLFGQKRVNGRNDYVASDCTYHYELPWLLRRGKRMPIYCTLNIYVESDE